MKSSAMWVLALVCVFAMRSTALANETFTMTADSTMDGNAGVLMRIDRTGEPSETAFLFDDAGMVRAYAVRAEGSPTWDILPGSQFLCPTTMGIGDTWRSLDEQGGETISTVVSQEMVTVPAGTFSCFKVAVVMASAPGTVIQNVWFSFDVGLVRQRDILPGPWQSDLFSHGLLGGSGFFPLAAGNIWQYQEVTTPVESATWGAVKALYE